MSPPAQPPGETPDDLTVEEIRSALRDVVQSYEPSRAAIERRVARGRSAAHTRSGARGGQHAPRVFFTMRPVGAALAVVVVMVLSVVAVRFAGDRAVDDPPVAAPVAVSSPAASRAPTSVPTSSRAGASSGQHSRPPTSAPQSSAPASSATPTAASNGILTAAGVLDPHSGDNWSQTNVTVANTKAISSLLITIKIVLTAGAADAGRFSTVPNGDVTMTVTSDAKTLTYRYELRSGATLKPGTYLFAAQYLHNPGRATGQDSYTVVAKSGSADCTMDGTFG